MKVVYYFMIICMLVGMMNCDENDEVSTSYQENGTDAADKVEETRTIKKESKRNDFDERDESEVQELDNGKRSARRRKPKYGYKWIWKKVNGKRTRSRVIYRIRRNTSNGNKSEWKMLEDKKKIYRIRRNARIIRRVRKKIRRHRIGIKWGWKTVNGKRTRYRIRRSTSNGKKSEWKMLEDKGKIYRIRRNAGRIIRRARRKNRPKRRHHGRHNSKYGIIRRRKMLIGTRVRYHIGSNARRKTRLRWRKPLRRNYRIKWGWKTVSGKRVRYRIRRNTSNGKKSEWKMLEDKGKIYRSRRNAGRRIRRVRKRSRRHHLRHNAHLGIRSRWRKPRRRKYRIKYIWKTVHGRRVRSRAIYRIRRNTSKGKNEK